jgi:hypothetical protein
MTEICGSCNAPYDKNKCLCVNCKVVHHLDTLESLLLYRISNGRWYIDDFSNEELDELLCLTCATELVEIKQEFGHSKNKISEDKSESYRCEKCLVMRFDSHKKIYKSKKLKRDISICKNCYDNKHDKCTIM